MSQSPTETDAVHARVVHDAAANELTVVVDAFPASIDDVSVAVGSQCIEITIAREDTVSEGYVSLPSRAHRFTDDRRAWYNNGVLTITVGTRRSRARLPAGRFER